MSSNLLSMESTTWIIIYIVVLQNIYCCNTIRFSSDVQHLAMTLGTTINQLFNDTTRIDDLSKRYSTYVDRGYMTMNTVVGFDIFNDLSRALGSLLSQKINAMKTAVKFAERRASNYSWNKDLKMDSVTYLNGKEFDAATEQRLEYDPLFLQSIIRNESTVHVPTELFKGDIEVLNGIEWSKVLDEVWIENQKKDPNLLWQYFASQRGFFRTFPGMKWRKKGVDMYDCRRRPWYVQGSSSPKDVMVLIDTSGSMHGKSLQLTKTAVKHTIDTLGENDYVAVMQFPGAWRKNIPRGVKRDKSPHLLKDEDGRSCFDTFVQATKRNKYRIFKQIDGLRAHGIADMTLALEMAFNTFLEFSLRRNPFHRGANCNRIIIILSDDAATYPKERIEELRKTNPMLQRIRIFAYSVGSDVHRSVELERMACDFKGSYNRIPAYGAVTHIIHDVSTILSRPMYLADGKFSVWHNIYLDSLGLGLMTSLTMPIYNSSGNNSLLGLMGTDVTVTDMEELLPLEKLGINGYAFAINLNGYVVFHRDLKSQNGWMLDPPNVDLMEVEFDSPEKRKVRKKIIDSGAEGISEPRQMKISGFVKVMDEIHVYNKTRQYIYGGIPNSKFGLTVVLPEESKYYPAFTTGLEHQLTINGDESFSIYDKIIGERVKLDLFDSYFVKMTSEVDFCEKYLRFEPLEPPEPKYQNVSVSHKFDNTTLFFTPVDEMASSSDEEEEIRQPKRQPEITVAGFLRTLVYNESHCRKGPSYRSHFMKHSLLDLVASQLHLDVLRNYSHIKHNPNIESIFITTNGGITRVFPANESERYHSFRNTRKSSEYTRAFDMDKLLLWTPLSLGKPLDSAIPFNRSMSLTIFKSFSITINTSTSKDNYKLGVIGTTIRQNVITRILNESSICNTEYSSATCYIVEDAAYVVAVNRPEMANVVGFFLGYIDPVVMNHLLNTSVFDRVKEFDYQASCPKETFFTSSASSSSHMNVSHTINWLLHRLSAVIEFLAELTVALLNLVIPMVSVSAQEATATSNQNESCIKLAYRYFPTGKSFRGQIFCRSCQRFVHAIPIQGTNSLLIVTSPPCDGCPGINYPLRDPVKDAGPDLCEDSEQTRYRRRRNHCYDLDPNEVDNQCSGTSSLHLFGFSRVLLLLLFLQYMRSGV